MAAVAAVGMAGIAVNRAIGGIERAVGEGRRVRLIGDRPLRRPQPLVAVGQQLPANPRGSGSARMLSLRMKTPCDVTIVPGEPHLPTLAKPNSALWPTVIGLPTPQKKRVSPPVLFSRSILILRIGMSNRSRDQVRPWSSEYLKQ